MTYTLGELAERVAGKLTGDPTIPISKALPLLEATENSITFVAEKRYYKQLSQTSAAAVLLPHTLSPTNLPTIQVEDPLAAILQIALLLQPSSEPGESRIDPRAAIDPLAQIGPGCWIGPFAVIAAHTVVGPGSRVHSHAVVGEYCSLGREVQIHPHAVLYPHTHLEDRVIVHSHAVLGADGFGYRFQNGRHEKLAHFGAVEVGADVEIGAGSTIDRAMLGTTRIGAGTKIDNLVMIAHNCQIGQHNLLVSQVGIAGSSVTEDYVTIAGQVGIADHLRIGKGATIAAGSGIHVDIAAGETVWGAPAKPIKEAARFQLALEKVPQMRRELAQLTQAVEQLQAQLGQMEANPNWCSTQTATDPVTASKLAS